MKEAHRDLVALGIVSIFGVGGSICWSKYLERPHEPVIRIETPRDSGGREDNYRNEEGMVQSSQATVYDFSSR